jgi:Mg2+-importing ATPase
MAGQQLAGGHDRGQQAEPSFWANLTSRWRSFGAFLRRDREPLVMAAAATSTIIMAIGVMLPYSPSGENLGFTTLSALYWPLLATTLVSYVAMTRVVKAYLLRKMWT